LKYIALVAALPPIPAGAYRDGTHALRCAQCFALWPCDAHGDTPMTAAHAVDALDTAQMGLELVPLGQPFIVDAVALERRGGPPTLEQCGTALERVKKVYCGVRYWLGDLLLLTEGLFAEEASQIIDQELLTEADVKAFTFVSKNVAPTTRSHALSWEHAKAVAPLKSAERQVEWLDRARGENWSPRKLATEIEKANATGKTELKFWLVVGPIPTEAKMETLAKKVEADGYGVKRQEKLKKVKTAKKAKKAITARKKRAGGKASQRRRTA
jgi:hypothetical protein